MKKLILSLATVALFFSCSDDDDVNPIVEIPEEVITNVDVTLTPDNGGDPVVLSFVDTDGISFGEEGEIIAQSTLEANTTYRGAFSITNTLAEDEEEMNVTAEILELDNEHQFFFIPDVTSDLEITDITYNDIDDNEYPVGLDFSFTTGAASSGDFNIVLRHEPNKSAAGVSDGDITNETDGSTDFDLFFPIVVEEEEL